MSRALISVCLSVSVFCLACSGKKEQTPEEKAAAEKAARTEAIKSEATMNLQKLFDGSNAYYQKDHLARGQQGLVDKQFPDSAEAPADWKAKVCPEAGKPAKKYTPDGNTWSGETWQRLNFAISDPFYNRYVYESKGIGSNSQGTIKAISDPNCDGNEVVVELKFKANDQKKVIKLQ